MTQKKGMLSERVKTIGIIIGIITGALIPGMKYLDIKADEKIKTSVECLLKKDLRELRIMIEFNKMQAKKDSVTREDWNRAIDIIDNSGTIR